MKFASVNRNIYKENIASFDIYFFYYHYITVRDNRKLEVEICERLNDA